MVNLGIIGTNKITDKFLEAGKTLPDFKLKAVYSRSMERAVQYAEKHGAELVFDNLEELAKCEEIDAVYIASPNSLHAKQSILMMQHGKHVLCEKPIASNRGELEKMIQAAAENQVVLMEAMRSVHAPGFQVIRDNLHKLGVIRRVSFQYCQYSSRYDKFKQGIIENAFNPALSNGSLMDIGVYCVHLLVAFFGMPDKITGNCLKLHNGLDGAGTILVEYKSMQGELLYSKITDSGIPSQIQGEAGCLVIDKIQEPRRVTIHYRDGSTEEFDIPQVENNMCYEIDDFMTLIQNASKENPYLEYSLMQMEVMDEARRQQGIVFPADAT